MMVSGSQAANTESKGATSEDQAEESWKKLASNLGAEATVDPNTVTPVRHHGCRQISRIQVKVATIKKELRKALLKELFS
ncbi:hypothetical protein NDU88_002136 [Pleurodeles waltl]|uniref:Uncharacterized protein n=1 Tax=Pleurodeles waltl TaxID=8319 RepID=A0AAV7KVA1_PLEWA|nr:hypothetical protein NDU88_002136 [Pleurodeles waltl]